MDRARARRESEKRQTPLYRYTLLYAMMTFVNRTVLLLLYFYFFLILIIVPRPLLEPTDGHSRDGRVLRKGQHGKADNGITCVRAARGFSFSERRIACSCSGGTRADSYIAHSRPVTGCPY